MNTLLRGGTLVTCDANDRVFHGDLLVVNGRIAALGPDARHTAKGIVHVLDARGCVVMPGLVQTHVHLCQTLFRGMADDLPLLQWLRQRIWPLEAAHTRLSLRASADLGALELIQGGTTTVLDMGTVHHHDVVFESLRDAGLRGFSGKAMMDTGEGVPSGLRETTEESLRESDDLCQRWHNTHNQRLRYAFAPRFILSCTRQLLLETARIARLRGALIHTHAAEHPDEREAVRAIYGRDDVDELAALGIAGPDVILAHGVQLTPKQRRRMGRDGTRVVHCPSSNMKLGSGVARVVKMRAAGMFVSLGADGAPCNNNLDAWVEMRHAALLAKRTGDPTAMPAREVVRMATIDGARALGLDAEIGSLEIGKRADVIAVSIDGAHCEPGGDALTRLAYAVQSRDVRHVLVDGKILMQFREVKTLHELNVIARARSEGNETAARASISPK
jgi:5-methylthioadenosine/S-adenosylhomocysteine deaminase